MIKPMTQQLSFVIACAFVYSAYAIQGLYSLISNNIRSHEVLKPRDLGLNFSNQFEIWQAPWQQGCWDACEISERYDHNIQSHGFETSRDLAVRYLTA